jgi:hypothetical protein
MNLYQTQKAVAKWSVVIIMLLAIGAVLFMSMAGTNFDMGNILTQKDMSEMFGILGKL